MDVPDSSSAVEVTELTGGESGIWLVTTRDSTHIFNFVRGLVTRIPGPNASPGPHDHPCPIRWINSCRVGENGYWTMHADDWAIDYLWQYTSTIQRIERVEGGVVS